MKKRKKICLKNFVKERKSNIKRKKLPFNRNELVENIITVKGLDIVSGTPILDIKPYTSQYDKVKNAKVPDWVNKLVF